MRYFLCNNLTTGDLKSFLISVQKQLDGIAMVKDIKECLIESFSFNLGGFATISF